MSPEQIWSNLVNYALQIVVLAGIAGGIPILLKLKAPRARLLCWQLILLACLALPVARPWRQEVVNATSRLGTAVITAATALSNTSPARRPFPLPEIALWLVAAGIVIRLFWLGIGVARLSAYRRRGIEALPERLTASTQCDFNGITVLLSDDVSGPVTFGWLRPAILLPAAFLSIDEDMREAILCHELLHVRRRDWLWVTAEELTRAVLWFHPAIWWIISEIQLAREQTVDQAVIAITQARYRYIDALMLMAGAPAEPTVRLDLSPAPMFLRRRHLKKRILSAIQEAHMKAISKTQLVCTQAMTAVLIAGACWLAAGTYRLTAAPQLVADAPGVTVNMNGYPLMHRTSVPYPADALAKGIEGTLVVQAKVDANGEVIDAAILSGPDELRKAVLQSVLAWHFEKSTVTTHTVTISFLKPTGGPPASLRVAIQPRPAGSSGNPPRPVAFTTGKIERITVAGLSDQSKDQLLSQLPIKAGDEWSPQTLTATMQAAKAFDSHLATTLVRNANGGFEVRISLPFVPPPVTAPAPMPSSPGVYSVGNGVQPPAVLSKVDPQYSEEARAAKYSGTVTLAVVVGTDGVAEDMHVVKSLGMGLDEKAVEAVSQWRFRPGTMNGTPVKVKAQIEINFNLL